MSEFSFRYLNKQDFSVYAPLLFSILHNNMSVIAPSENSYDEEFVSWIDTFGNAFLHRSEWKVALAESDGDIIGFFAYNCTDKTFMMQEIQFSDGYKGRHGIFRKLYHFVTSNLPKDLMYVEAYANKNNEKSIAILNRLGLKNIGTNKSGECFHFKGTYQDFLSWLNG